MSRKRKREGKANQTMLPVMRPDAAGIDIGATEIFVAVPADRAVENVRSFPTLPQDLYALADWLAECRVKTVAMESTGVYWIPLFQILAERGFEVCLVNARHVKNVPGRRTDVWDCQWLQFLHSVGLLRALRSRRCARCVPCCGTGRAWSRWQQRTSVLCRKRWTR